MRTRIKVTDLTAGQWDWLERNLRDSYEIPDTAIRVGVQFEIDVLSRVLVRHVEMSVRAFAVLVSQLQSLQIQAGAMLTPDALPDHLETVRNAADPARAAERTCDHGAAVTGETPSVFEGAEPVRDYADGCQSYGPYQTTDQG